MEFGNLRTGRKTDFDIVTAGGIIFTARQSQGGGSGLLPDLALAPGD